MFKTHIYRILLDPDPAIATGGGATVVEPVPPVVPEVTPAAPATTTNAPAVDIYTEDALAADAQRFNKLFSAPPAVKPNVVPAAPTAPTPAPTPAAPAAPAAPPLRGPGTRDLSWLPPEHHKAAREMSAPAFSLFQQRWQEAERLRTEHAAAVQAKTTLETELSSAKGFLDHPDGYRVTPEYVQATEELSNADAALEHLNAQLVAVNQNKKWRPLMEYVDPTTKRIMLRAGEPQEASAEAVAQLTNQLSYARMQQYQAQQRVAQLPQQFQQQRQQFTTGLTATVDKLVKPLYTALESQAKPIADMLRSQIPPIYRRSEVFEPLVLALATMHAMARNQMNSGANTTLQTDAARSGAITTATPAAAAGAPADPYEGVTDDMFTRYSRYGTNYSPSMK